MQLLNRSMCCSVQVWLQQVAAGLTSTAGAGAAHTFGRETFSPQTADQRDILATLTDEGRGAGYASVTSAAAYAGDAMQALRHRRPAPDSGLTTTSPNLSHSTAMHEARDNLTPQAMLLQALDDTIDKGALFAGQYLLLADGAMGAQVQTLPEQLLAQCKRRCMSQAYECCLIEAPCYADG